MFSFCRKFLFFYTFLSAITLFAAGEKKPKNYQSQVYIVVHGTWGSEYDWYLPDGDFFDGLKKGIKRFNPQSNAPISFTWSGRLSHKHRMRAAKQLKHLIQSYPPSTEIYLIGHSHGANVCSLASQELKKSNPYGHKIHTFFAIGAPVDPIRYMPNYDVIGHILHFLSFNDLVQPVWGHYGREYPEHMQCANLRVVINGKQPDHFQLHDPTIAYWIPCILNQLKEHELCSKIKFSAPKVVYINDETCLPKIEQDPHRQLFIRLDKNLHKSRWQVFKKCMHIHYGDSISLKALLSPSNIKNSAIYAYSSLAEFISSFWSPFAAD